ncbi:glycosyltransferase family 4 protein [Zobellia roscoffensis]|uniref:glycosyltransferase family 4 protein n=1 Tax=Zobellia roscoffensis TaxID=2779508 RepID=UPI00188B9042|nr:glycosyltransferase family 4 protein [Zobellia roscoffensis]
MERKKIAFVIYSLESGGAERVITELANNLILDYDVYIITLVKTNPFYELNPRITLRYCSDVIKNDTTPIKSIYDGLNRVRTLSKILKENKIQLVISFMTSSNIYSIWASKLSRIPCIVSERANHDIYKLPKLLEVTRDISYRFCKYLVVQTEANKIFYSKKLSPSKIIVIPNPIAEALSFKRNKEPDRLKNIILNVGSFKKGKAQELLIQAFSKIKNEDWQVVFVGDGPTKKKNIDLTKKLGLEKKINFVGKQQVIYKYYNQAKLFVFTSEHEGFPNALLEALYFGIPTISTNCKHGPTDLIKDKENGFLIPVGNQNVLQKKMSQLMNDIVLQNKFSENAMKSTEKYKITSIVKLWENYITKLV